jgi:predicted nucleotidyltransferase
MRNDELRAILQELRAGFDKTYGTRLVQMVLFGSQARGEASESSDIDVMVILSGRVEPASEISRTSRIVADICLKHGVVISCVFVDEASYRRRNGPLLRSVRKEGVAV